MGLINGIRAANPPLQASAGEGREGEGVQTRLSAEPLKHPLLPLAPIHVLEARRLNGRVGASGLSARAGSGCLERTS